MDNPVRITDNLLKKHGACADQRRLFRQVFPGGTTVTLAACRKARKAGLSVGWIAGLLPSPLWAEYDRQTTALQAEYDKQIDPLWAKYSKQITALSAEYDRQTTALRAERDRQITALWAEYYKRVDRVLVAAFKAAA